MTEFGSWQGKDTFLFAEPSRLALGLSQFPVQWVPAVKRLGYEDDHNFHLGRRLRMNGIILPVPHMSSWRTQGKF